ncbi:hypothetical protein [Halorussus halophilus]|uniref:hypothetical protein n=1 Tax=Halorussus halophilus TaxID=2650975 RepID=UPI00130150B0|nr:hypothetical protein [Halorussus halophilus]
MPFPAESIPDGALFAPHHFLYGLYLVLFRCARKWDNYPRTEPLVVAGSALFALFGWAHLWRYYPVAGATVCVVGTLGTVVGGLVTTKYGRRWQLFVVWSALVALDDAISHAFGVWTPLDWLWNFAWRLGDSAALLA